MIIIELPGIPKGKGRPRFVRTGHVYNPPETVAYENELRKAAWAVMGRRKPLDGPVKVTVQALFPIPKNWSQSKRIAVPGTPYMGKPDIDNVFKGLADALNGICWHDDKQIVTAIIFKSYANKPALVIGIEPENA